MSYEQFQENEHLTFLLKYSDSISKKKNLTFPVNC